MPAGNNQRERVRRKRAKLQLRNRNMPDDMIDTVNRFVRRPCKRFGSGNPDGESACQPRACGHGNRIDVGKLKPGIRERLLGARDEGFGMSA